MLDVVGNSRGIVAYSQKEVSFGSLESLEGKDQIKDKCPKENFFGSLEGREQIKDENLFKENPLKNKDSFNSGKGKLANSFNDIDKDVFESGANGLVTKKQLQLEEIQRLQLIIRIGEGKKLARKKSMMPKMPLSASEQADLDLYIDHLAEELKKLAQFRTQASKVVNIAKKLPRI